MNAAILDPADDGGARARRWAVCLGLVAALHALPLLVLAWWLGPVSSTPAQPPAAVMIDMAPEPPAPAPTTQTSVAPKPPQVVTPKARRPPGKPTLPLVQKAEFPAPRADDTPRQTDKAPVQRTTTQRAEIAPPAPAAAPARSAPEANSSAVPTWQGLMLGRLERFKRYPPLAQMRAQQGVAYLRFTMNRDGKVLSAKIEKSSGYDLLDEETLALIRRAEPLPKPPPEVTGDTIQLVAPVEFFLSGRR